ncbi:MAG: hypothetical protein ACRD15_09205, partial [Vicinamibacterales bacterium]
APVGTPRPQDGRFLERMDANATRQALMEVLGKHPPSVGRVMRLDPSLMRNESYLDAYPQLRDFLAQHPEIPQNSAYYLEGIRGHNEDWQPPNPQQRMMEGILSGLAGFTAFAVVLGTLIWLIRTSLDHRRWNRLSRIQAEVHTKLMDRFSSNDELLTYVQTPSGRRFLESGPSPLQEIAPAMGAPFSRILWSVQLGAVLLVSGMGLLFLSGRAIPEAREFFYVFGCLATAIGAGFVVSAAAAYVLSRRLGLLDRPVQNNA